MRCNLYLSNLGHRSNSTTFSYPPGMFHIRHYYMNKAIRDIIPKLFSTKESLSSRYSMSRMQG